MSGTSLTNAHLQKSHERVVPDPPNGKWLRRGTARRGGRLLYMQVEGCGRYLSQAGCAGDPSPIWATRFDLSQCVMEGPGVPSDQAPTTTMKIVARSSGSFAAITGEPGRFAPQLLAASPET